MKLQLNGYEVEIERMYIYKVYVGLLCGRIDTYINDKEEGQAKKELNKFACVENANLYLPPHRNKVPIGSLHSDVQEMINEDYLSGRYNADNFPEAHLEQYWVF